MQEHEAWDDLPDPWEGDHDIEYWLWHADEDRLMPATPDELAHIKEDERTRDALYRLERMREREWREAHRMGRRLAAARARCADRVRMTIQWLKLWSRRGTAAHTEEARAERSSSR